MWADHLSRLPLHYEWKLHPELFKQIDRTWGPHTIDRFACMANTQLPRYNSRFMDPLSEGIDALSQQDWALENNYANPPFRLINRLLDLVQEQGATVTLIAPKWPSQLWYSRMRNMLIDQPMKLPNKHWAMLPMGGLAEPLKNSKWKIYAWRISGARI